ncbi:TATA-box-binding protein [Trypanosoma cruzi]|uniref:TATA box-binding protein-like 1 n=2 Tax=Trypanosoma cruzi TaxID=5693 RepID=Q4DK05_TRYCC|nr:TFIID-like protein, putative [Trypanosoma cruzi]EAN92868.1 TFIID-like protein, putative [Trypanosoma cruzi]PWV21732.1 TATA-box-binding protein [Trypanosoma cruzi]RNC48430.1 TFIID-like protein [Trypanosoma cruzi]|eukprot:XP_814719.1 TFIID-like protein [Trypanosoma cruzi strain CL Brener]
MDDDFDNFGGDFDLDENEFLEDAANDPSDAAEFDYTLFSSAHNVSRPNDDNDNTNSEEVRAATPPNIQELFPNAAPDTMPVIVGIIAQAKLGVGVDLCALSCATRNVEFVPRNRTPAATMRLHEPTAVVLVRTSGFMSIIGAASVGEAKQATELAARIIRKALSLDITTVQFRVRSVTARFDVGHPIRLEELAQHEGIFCSYEPDRFSGCIVRLAGKSHDNQWQVSCTVFVTGKVSILGARSQKELQDAFYTLLPILAQYAKK